MGLRNVEKRGEWQSGNGRDQPKPAMGYDGNKVLAAEGLTHTYTHTYIYEIILVMIYKYSFYKGEEVPLRWDKIEFPNT